MADPTRAVVDTVVTTTLTPAQILDLPMQDNDSGADTIRGYLIALLTEVWREVDEFSGKRPFGNSDWVYDLYVPLVGAGVVEGSLDDDGYSQHVDYRTADRLIADAIQALGDTS